MSLFRSTGNGAPRATTRKRTSAGAYKLLGDEPFRADKDPLGFDHIADNLTKLILLARASSPFTLGIEGGWGTGKSSLMQRLEARLRGQDGIETVWFNAWAVEDGQALEGLVKSVLAQLKPWALWRAAHKRQLIGWAKLAISLVGAWFGISSLVNSLWTAFEVDPKARSDLQKLMKDVMKEWVSKGREPEGRLLVVFIDDLDRCPPENVFQIFEAVKVHLSTQGMVFVVGYDKQIVSESVLKEKRYSASIKSADYLEKIIQVSYRMPRPSDHASEKLIASYVRESGTRRLFSDPTIKELAVERNARNPRRIKRFINAFILEWGLDPEWGQQKFDPAVVVRVVILYMYFTDFAILLETSDDEDPVEQFQRYFAARQALWQRPAISNREGWEPIEELTSRYGLRAVAVEEPVDYKAVLADIEDQLPPCFRLLAQHGDFVILLDGLGDGDNRERLLAKLRRSRPSARASAVESTPVGKPSVQPLPPPRGTPPYRLNLRNVVDKERVEHTSQQGSIVFHTMGSTGGAKEPRPQAAVAQAMLRDFEGPGTAPMFLYLLGDVIYFNGHAEDYYPQFYEPYTHYSAPIFAIPGGHDGDNSDDPSRPSLTAFVDNFCASAAVPTPESGGTRDAMTQPHVYWTLRAPFTTIIGLYTNVPQGGYVDDDQLNWFTGELAEAPIDDALIVALHHDPYSADLHHRGSLRMSKVLDVAFAKSGRVPDLVLSAHTHNYQRFTRNVNGRALSYIVAGAGGYHNLHKMHPDASLGMQIDQNLVLDSYCDDRYGFLRVTTSAGSLRGDYVTVGLRDEGSQPTIIDSFTSATGTDTAHRDLVAAT